MLHLVVSKFILMMHCVSQDDSNTYVHKQGFLVKQGHKVKNWRKRMFVLDTQTLAYYKTEQVIKTVIIIRVYYTVPNSH